MEESTEIEELREQVESLSEVTDALVSILLSVVTAIAPDETTIVDLLEKTESEQKAAQFSGKLAAASQIHWFRKSLEMLLPLPE